MLPSGKAVPPVSQVGPWKLERRNGCQISETLDSSILE
jgi:hypothetical protein